MEGWMSTVMVEIPVDEATAEALADPHRLAAVAELVKSAVHPTEGNDLLSWVLESTARKAAAAGLTEQDIENELAAWKAGRAARKN
jgi:Glu-tRNA(Gln) amidotransferase subunit E-like FAD-binding protein